MILVIFAIAYLSPDFMMSSYVLVLSLFLFYGLVKRNITVVSMVSILLLINASEYFAFKLYMNYVSEISNKTHWHEASAFLVQSVHSLMAIILLLKRPNICHQITSTATKHLEHYDKLLILANAYLFTVSTFAAFEYILRKSVEFNRFDFIYVYYEHFIYFGWAMVFTALICTVSKRFHN